MKVEKTAFPAMPGTTNYTIQSDTENFAIVVTKRSASGVPQRWMLFAENCAKSIEHCDYRDLKAIRDLCDAVIQDVDREDEERREAIADKLLDCQQDEDNSWIAEREYDERNNDDEEVDW